MEADFGILPFPMWDEIQESYRSYANPSAPSFAIPSTVSNLERTGIIMEALSAEGYRTIIPEYYDVILKVRDTRDDESELSIDFIGGNLFFEITFFYSLSFTSINSALVPLLFTSKSKDFVSYYTKTENAALTQIEKFIGIMTKN